VNIPASRSAIIICAIGEVTDKFVQRIHEIFSVIHGCQDNNAIADMDTVPNSTRHDLALHMKAISHAISHYVIAPSPKATNAFQ
jgi:hypothetical protein